MRSTAICGCSHGNAHMGSHGNVHMGVTLHWTVVFFECMVAPWNCALGSLVLSAVWVAHKKSHVHFSYQHFGVTHKRCRVHILYHNQGEPGKAFCASADLAASLIATHATLNALKQGILPQTDVQTVRMNCTMEDMLKHFLTPNVAIWGGNRICCTCVHSCSDIREKRRHWLLAKQCVSKVYMSWARLGWWRADCVKSDSG